MSFFEPPPPREEPEERPQAAWVRSPDNELGVAVPLRLVLVQTPVLALLVDQVVAYTRGFSFRLAGRSRPGAGAANRRRFDHMFMPPRGVDMDRLLVGVEFADGRKATNLVHGPPEGDSPRLMGGGGSSGGGRFDIGFWLWPLPPDGPLAFVTQWAEEGIELTRAQIDASAIRGAGAQSEPLWPELGGEDGGSTRKSFRIAWGSADAKP